MERKTRVKGYHQRQTANASANSKHAPPKARNTNTRSTIPTVSVENMTSRDFQHDTHAHIDHTAQVLKDVNCIRNFQMVINLNKHLFAGKTVLDIGCGAGILSLFAAKAGAARVLAVDPSNVVHYTRKIVETNNYGEVIEVIQGRIEDISLPVAQVDIIICDWMGYSLLYQSTCEAIIYARDKWLRQGGHIFPDVAKLFICGFEDPERKNQKIEWWKNVYGFNMKCLRGFALREPSVYAMKPEQIITTDFKVKTLNLYTAKIGALGFRALYTLRMLRSGLIDGIVTYFQVHFSKSHTPYMFSTDPWSPQTHWMQSAFFFELAVPASGGEILCGGFEMVPSDSDSPNLNNIEVALELCCREPLQLQVDMRWQLKPHIASAATALASSSANLPPPPKENAKTHVKENESGTSPFLDAILKKSGTNRNMVTHKKKFKKIDVKKEIIYTY